MRVSSRHCAGLFWSTTNTSLYAWREEGGGRREEGGGRREEGESNTIFSRRKSNIKGTTYHPKMVTYHLHLLVPVVALIVSIDNRTEG